MTLVCNANWIEFTLRYVVDYKSRRATRDRLFPRVLEQIYRLDGRAGIAAGREPARRRRTMTMTSAASPPVEMPPARRLWSAQMLVQARATDSKVLIITPGG